MTVLHPPGPERRNSDAKDGAPRGGCIRTRQRKRCAACTWRENASGWRTGLIRAAATTLTLAIFSQAASADVVAAELAGSWRGNGEMALGAGDRAQRGRCNVEIREGPTARSLVISGLCAAGAGRTEFTLSMDISGDDRVRASLMTDRLSAEAGFTGQLRGDRIELNSISLFSVDDVLYSSRISIAFDGSGGFSLQQWQRPDGGGEERQALSMTFERS